MTTFTSAQDNAGWLEERDRVYKDADRAISELKELLAGLEEDDFSETPSRSSTEIGKIEVPAGTPNIKVLRQHIQFLIAQIDLAQDYPSTKFDAEKTLDDLLSGKSFFGTPADHDFEAFQQKLALIDRLFDDRELQLGNRLFGLAQTGKDSHHDAIEKWLKYTGKVAGPYYFGTSFERQPTTLGRSVKALSILSGVVHSEVFQETLESNADLKFRTGKMLKTELRPVITKFAMARYRRGGLLRDWCLPVVEVGRRLFPDMTRESVGVASLAEYQKASLAHARALTQLIARIDDPSPIQDEVQRALKTMNEYRSLPHYIGAMEIRESGTLKVPADQEVEVLLKNAQFFGENGHNDLDTYKRRSEHLDALFHGEDSKNNLELLVALKSPAQWLKFFETHLFGKNDKDDNAVFPRINRRHAITVNDLKILFLARSILPSEKFSSQFEPESDLASKYDSLLVRFGDTVRDTSAVQFRNYSKEWINIQNGFLEIAKGFPRYSFENLKVTTSTDLKMVRKDFEASLFGRNSVSEDFLSLLVPDSVDLIPSIDHMTSPKLSRRLGKFDRTLSPEFVNTVNEKLWDILEYRGYGLAAIDSLDRPDLQVGRIMTHFAVTDYRIPGDSKTNTVIHDLICGPEGGFGGLGQLFRPDAKSYKERESALDAIATSPELELGEVLFRLALDINRNNETSDEDQARAAARWIQYFRKSQANAQFHAVPEVLNQAIRGTFLSRIVFQSESFQKALEKSRNAPVGSSLDISHDLEAAFSAQIRKMQGMLAKVDPETATNRNIEETADQWQDFKVWFLESTKWLEAVIDEPIVIGEVTRVRKLKNKIADYRKLCPEVLVFKKSLEHFGGEFYNQPEPPTIGLARFAMETVTELEPDLNLPLPEMEGTPENEEKLRQMEFGKAVSNQFLKEIRDAVSEAGFEELANVNNASEIAPLIEESLPSEAKKNVANTTVVTNRAKALEDAMLAAVARAVSRVEANQPSDLRVLEGQTIRAAKVDRILSERELPQYRIDLQPSLVVNDWINRDKVEIMANVRTVEKRAEARQLVNMAREERRMLSEIQGELQAVKADSLQKLELLQRWIDDSEGGTNVEVVMEEVIEMRKQVSSLQKEVSNLKDSESIMRARAADFAQQLFQYKRGGKQEVPEIDSDSDMGNSIASAPREEPEPVIIKPPSRSTSNYQPRNSNSNNRTRSRPRSSGNFFQRLFGRNR